MADFAFLLGLFFCRKIQKSLVSLRSELQNVGEKDKEGFQSFVCVCVCEGEIIREKRASYITAQSPPDSFFFFFLFSFFFFHLFIFKIIPFFLS